MKAHISQMSAYIDLLLQDETGKPVSFVEIKSYRKPNRDIKEQTLNQMRGYAKRLGEEPRYFTILSPATGYVQDIKTNKTLEFSTEDIVRDYLHEPGTVRLANQDVLTSVFSTWLNDLSMGTRELNRDEKKLKEFGFIDNIRGTSSFSEYKTV